MKLLTPALSSSPGTRITHAAREALDPAWHPLYRLAAWAALLVVALVPVQAIVYVTSPPPDTVQGWFRLFNRNTLLALVDLDLLMVVDTILGAVLMLALVVALWRTAPAWIALAGLLEFLGAAAFFSSNPAFSMLALSRAYQDAATAVERERLLAAGEATMTTWNGSSYLVFYVLGGIATLIFSVVMLRGAIFSQLTGWVGVLTGILMLFPPLNPVLLVISFLSLIPMVVWFVLIALRLLHPAGARARGGEG